MKKIFSLLVLALCMLVTSVGLAAEKVLPEDFYGKWFMQGYLIEENYTPAVKARDRLIIEVYGDNHVTWGEYINLYRPEQTERQIPMAFVEQEIPKHLEDKEYAFLMASYFKMQRAKPLTPDTEYLLYMKNRDTMVLRTYFKQGGERAVVTWFFGKTDPFLQNARKYKLKKEA